MSAAASPAAVSPERSPRLTVVVPVFNVADWIEEFLFSLEQQTLRDFEAILVDDGSTDGTRDIVERHAERDARLLLIANTGSGGGAARNLGVSRASGVFLAFADGDDVLPARAFETMVEDLERTGSEMAVLDHLTFSSVHTGRREQDLGIYGEQRTGITLNDVPLLLRDRVCWKKAFRLDWWRENDIAFSDSARSNDIFAMVQAYVAAERIDIVPEVGYCYRRRPGRSSMSAQAHEVRSLRDHFREELKCYQALNGLLDHEARRVYFTNLLTWDVFAHLSGLAGQVITAENAELWAEAVAAARYLFEQAPAEVISELGYDRRSLYGLLGPEDRGELLQFWPGATEPTIDQVLSELAAPGTGVVLRRAVAAGAPGALARVKVMLDEHFLQTLLRHWDEVDAGERGDALRRLRALTLELIPREELRERERRLFQLADDSPVEVPEWLRSMLAAGKVKVTADRMRDGALRVTVMIGRAGAPIPDLVLRRPGGERVVLHVTPHSAKAGSCRVTPDALGEPGTWSVALQWVVDGHKIVDPVYDRQIEPAAKLDPLKPLPSDGGTPVVIRFDSPARRLGLAARGGAVRAVRGARRRAGWLLRGVGNRAGRFVGEVRARLE